MQRKIGVYLTSLVSMLIVDALWLTITIDTLYRPKIGHLLAAKPVLWAALLFYPLYALGITTLVVLPRLNEPSGGRHVLFSGALLGAVAYGTFDLTSQSLFINWPPLITLVDILWGTCLSAAISLLSWRVFRKS
jgi:uncharacterized membrane protein